MNPRGLGFPSTSLKPKSPRQNLSDSGFWINPCPVLKTLQFQSQSQIWLSSPWILEAFLGSPLADSYFVIHPNLNGSFMIWSFIYEVSHAGCLVLLCEALHMFWWYVSLSCHGFPGVIVDLFHSPAVYNESCFASSLNTLHWQDFPTQGIFIKSNVLPFMLENAVTVWSYGIYIYIYIFIIVNEKEESFINYNKNV